MTDTRPADALRPVTIEPHPTAVAAGYLICAGETRVLCTASVQKKVPDFLIDRETGEPTQGWVTSEYAMLPGSTPDRKRRGPDSRGTEIKRLIGRSLRAAVDLEAMAGVSITIDCDVLVADGGTRTAAITGGYVALARGVTHAREQGWISGDPLRSPVAAVSVGIIDGQAYLDLDYPLDVRAEVDMNVVRNGEGEYVEIQGTGEGGTFSHDQLGELLNLADSGIDRLLEIQREALSK
ncbi:MAG: ribonuclease PH [Phycisphaeraceae bacterium]|nr:ribonuclease PH [Phycisphaeraceae bacterium]